MVRLSRISVFSVHNAGKGKERHESVRQSSVDAMRSGGRPASCLAGPTGEAETLLLYLRFSGCGEKDAKKELKKEQDARR